MRGAALAVLGAAALAACTAPTPPCPLRLRAELYMGGAVPPAAFADFLDRSVTPRFPQGLTVVEGAGRWRSPEGVILREPSRVVTIATVPGPETMALLEAIRAEYRRDFNQRSVGLITQPACASF